METTAPLVSVIVPTFNRAAYLREAVASVFAQTYANWELLVVDDGSSDGTRDYLASLGDSRVHVMTCPHSGNPGKVRNAALALARGFYVAFLDDDDLWMPDKLQLQVADLAARPSCHWSYTHYSRIGARLEPVPAGPPRPVSGWALAWLVSGARMATPTVLAERSLVSRVHGFDESLPTSEDYDLFVRLAMVSEVACVDRALCAVRNHPSNTWKASTLESLMGDVLRVYEKLLAGNLPPDIREACERRRVEWKIRRAYWFGARWRLGSCARHLVDAVRSARGLPASWLLKTCLRPLMPPPAMRVYRALRAL